MPQKTIVLVESDLDIEGSLQSITEQLDEAGFVVATDIDQATVMIRDLSPGLVVVNEDALPGTGRLVLECLKSAKSTQGTPIVVVGSDADAGRGLVQEGADVFLPRPLEKEDLAAVVLCYAHSIEREAVSW